MAIEFADSLCIYMRRSTYLLASRNPEKTPEDTDEEDEKPKAKRLKTDSDKPDFPPPGALPYNSTLDWLPGLPLFVIVI